MERSGQIFLDILCQALRGNPWAPGETLTTEQWNSVFRLAGEHNVLPMIYGAVYRLPELTGSPALMGVKQEVLNQVMRQEAKTREFLELYRHLTASGVRPLVVKGIVCRSLYPNPDFRISGDEDLLIEPEEYERCHETLTAIGMEPSEPDQDRENAYEVPYGRRGSPIYIELHKHLFPPESEAYGDLNRFFARVHHHAVTQAVQGQTVWTMAPTEHLFYLICHGFKHFLHGGFGIRQVCDIVMFAERHGQWIDWEQVLENSREIRAERFAAALLKIGEKHLGFDPEKAKLPELWRIIPVDETPMLEDLLQSGIFGGADMSRKHSATITLTAVADQKQGRRGTSGVLKSLFPPAKALEKRYTYLRKYPWLLPAAWASRIVRYGKEVKDAGTGNAAEAVKIGKERVELLKHYGVVDE